MRGAPGINGGRAFFWILVNRRVGSEGGGSCFEEPLLVPLGSPLAG